MIQTFKIQKGEVTFEPDAVRITDNAKKENRLQLFGSVMWMFYGILSVSRYLKNGDQLLLWSGLVLGIAYFVIFILTLYRSSESNISYDEIKSIKVKQRFSNNYIDIRLKNNKLRRVNKVDNSEELKDYIKSNIENITNS